MADAINTERFLSILFRFNDLVRIYRSKHSKNGRTFMALYELRHYNEEHEKPITMTEVSQITGLAPPNVCRLLKPLEQAGYVCREKCGRVVSVIVTEKGETFINEQQQIIKQLVSSAVESLTEEEFDNYIACSEKIISAMQENAQKIFQEK